ncbi:MAG: DNA-binding protein Alba [Methanosphaera sp.]|nr:DNA-binding protein Alba [Methanosphaera sp.]
MNYVLSIVTLINEDVERISIKARGRAINRAVDVAEVVRHKFVTKTQVENILINTEELPRDDGSLTNVSTIEIILRV